MVHFVSESRSLNGGMIFEGFAIWCTGTISGLKISLLNSFLGRWQMPASALSRHLRRRSRHPRRRTASAIADRHSIYEPQQAVCA
jgi:hypothetical protein